MSFGATDLGPARSRRFGAYGLLSSSVVAILTFIDPSPLQAASPVRQPSMPQEARKGKSLPDTAGVDPCHDFYQYAQHHRISPASWDEVFGDPLTGKTRVTLLQLLDAARASAASTKDPALRALGYFYGSCLADETGTAAKGAANDAVRAGYCLALIDRQVVLRKVLSRIYAEHILPPAASAQIREMVTQIQATIVERIQAMPWISDTTKERTLTALRTNRKIRVGIPENWDEYIGTSADLTLSPTDFGENLATVTNFPIPTGTDPSLGSSDGWGNRLYQFFAAAAGSRATIFPRVFQPPVFDPAADLAFNYGAAGVMISHEIMHAYDGKVGWNWRDPVLPLPAKEFKMLEQLTEQLGEQYARYDSLSGKPRRRGRNPFTASNEELADAGGLAVAHATFERVARGKSQEPINGLPPKHRFFVAFANIPRGNTDPYQASSRVNKLMRNMPAFARAFGCKVGDRMVIPPEEVVVIY